MFCTLNEFIEDTEDVRHDGNIKSKIINELRYLRCELAKHFHNIARDVLAFVRNPYLVAPTDLISIFNGDDNDQNEFIATKND